MTFNFSKDPLPNSREYLFSDAKCLKLDLPVPYEAMAEEAKALRSKFILYRNDDGYAHNEAAKDLHWTEIAEHCPVTVNWLKTVFPSNQFGRVRFMLLEAGGFISPHIDSPVSIPEPVNVALTNPEECNWIWGDGDILHFPPGTAYAMNISYEHSVYNNSDEDRYHLIIHHHDSTPEWKDMMKLALEKQDESGYFYYSQDLY